MKREQCYGNVSLACASYGLFHWLTRYSDSIGISDSVSTLSLMNSLRITGRKRQIWLASGEFKLRIEPVSIDCGRISLSSIWMGIPSRWCSSIAVRASFWWFGSGLLGHCLKQMTMATTMIIVQVGIIWRTTEFGLTSVVIGIWHHNVWTASSLWTSPLHMQSFLKPLYWPSQIQISLWQVVPFIGQECVSLHFLLHHRPQQNGANLIGASSEGPKSRVKTAKSMDTRKDTVKIFHIFPLMGWTLIYWGKTKRDQWSSTLWWLTKAKQNLKTARTEETEEAVCQFRCGLNRALVRNRTIVDVRKLTVSKSCGSFMQLHRQSAHNTTWRRRRAWSLSS